MIYLKLRHLSGSFFRVPVEKSDENPIKQYYQPVASYRTIKFNRFTLSNIEECKKRKGKNTGEQISFIAIIIFNNKCSIGML